MSQAILAINAGSSSIKYSLFGLNPEYVLLSSGKVTGLGTGPQFSAIHHDGTAQTEKLPPECTHEEAFSRIFASLESAHETKELVAVAHRVVHGGYYREARRIDDKVMAELKKFGPLAPLHQPHNLAAVDIISSLRPNLPQVACLDTAFHADQDPIIYRYAVPDSLYRKDVRRFSFHGLSYDWIARQLADKHPGLAAGKVIVAHLGNGSSLCAMQKGKSIDTSLGMTALDGVPMGTRCGNIDPGAVIYMVRDLKMSPDEAENVLYAKSGLKGLSGISNDVKTLLESTDPAAAFALKYYALRVAQFVGRLMISLGGLDALVFTGGIGENAEPVRNDILNHLKFLPPFKTLIIPANEEIVMAMQAAEVLGIKMIKGARS